MLTSSEFWARHHDLNLHQEDGENNIGLEEQSNKQKGDAHKTVSTAELTLNLAWNLVVLYKAKPDSVLVLHS